MSMLIQQDYAAGLETLQVAYNIKGIAEKDDNEMNKINAGKVIQFTESDRSYIFQLCFNYQVLNILLISKGVCIKLKAH